MPSPTSPSHANPPAERESARLLLLPGWLDSGPGHWQTHWASRPGFERVVQSDWLWPRRGDWMARLEEVLLEDATRPSLLIAHSLGCHLVAAWAAHSARTDRVCGALLVAPPDLQREPLPPNLFNWRPAVRRPLPWRSRLLASSNDPFASVQAARAMAEDWGSQFTVLGDLGHINADVGLGDWPQGLAIARSLLETRHNEAAAR